MRYQHIVTEKAVEQPSSSASHADPEPVQDKMPTMQGATLDLMMGAILPYVPVIMVTSLLLTLILRNQVDIESG